MHLFAGVVIVAFVVFQSCNVCSQTFLFEAIVRDDGNNVREYGGENYRQAKVLGVLNSGDVVRVNEIQGRWAKVQDYKGLAGWVNAACLVQKTTSQPAVKVQSNIATQSGAGVGKMPSGDSPQFIRSQEGCLVWDPAPQKGETVSWSGKCLDGYAHGRGVKRWMNTNQWEETDGVLKRGKDDGYFLSFKNSYGTKIYYDKNGAGKGVLGEVQRDGSVLHYDAIDQLEINRNGDLKFNIRKNGFSLKDSLQKVFGPLSPSKQNVGCDNWKNKCDDLCNSKDRTRSVFTSDEDKCKNICRSVDADCRVGDNVQVKVGYCRAVCLGSNNSASCESKCYSNLR